jgi:hypothetical protein
MIPEEAVMRTLVTLLIAALLIAVPSKGSGANPEHQTKSYLGPSAPHVPRDLRDPSVQRFAGMLTTTPLVGSARGWK